MGISQVISTTSVFHRWHTLAQVLLFASLGCSSTVESNRDDAGDVLTVDTAVADTAVVDTTVVDTRVDDAPIGQDTRVVDVPVLDTGRDVPMTMDTAPVDAPSDVRLPPGTCPGMPSGPMPEVCDRALCGNGMIDTCSRCAPCGGGGGEDRPFLPDSGRCCMTATESCDGMQLNGATCASLGFAGGSLRCGAWCGLDASGCDACARGEREPRCVGGAVPAVAPGGLDLAVRENVVGLAWLTGTGPEGVMGLHFTRFNAALERLGDSGCLPVDPPQRVAVAPTPSGWVLAVQVSSGLQVLPLTPDGAPSGAPRRIPGGQRPQMTARPGGGPLLEWQDARGVVAELLRPDGAEETPPVVAFTGSLEYGNGGATWVGDGFLLAERLLSNGVAIVPMDLLGRLGAMVFPVGTSSEFPQVTWSGREGRLVYAAFGGTPHMRWTRIGRMGNALGASVQLGRDREFFNPCPVLSDGDDTLVLLAGYSGGHWLARSLSAMRVGPAGEARTAPFPVNRSPGTQSHYRVARLGAELVTAWVEPGFPGQVVLATLRP
ncbi:MAG: hypothetical protein HY909_31200 [Deltaproteobacteria bacterium]|nr:hypothetical protein [Deltaproteobacteria bacterium]